MLTTSWLSSCRCQGLKAIKEFLANFVTNFSVILFTGDHAQSHLALPLKVQLCVQDELEVMRFEGRLVGGCEANPLGRRSCSRACMVASWAALLVFFVV